MSRPRPRSGKPAPPPPPAAEARLPLLHRMARRPYDVAGALAAVHLLLALAVFNPAPFMGGDNATYVSLARSMLGGHGYVELWDPAQRPYTLYPPVFPAIIALAFVVGLQSFVALKYVVIAFSCAAVAVTWLWLRRRTSPAVALGAAALLAVGPGVVELTHWELSDIPFWLFTAVGLWAFAHLEASAAPAAAAGEGDGGGASDGGRGMTRWVVAAALGTALAYLTRSAGLPLLVAAFGALALRRRWRWMAVFAAVALPGVAAWTLRGHLLGGSYSSYVWYVDPYQPEKGTATLAQLLIRALLNARNYTTQFVPSLLLGGGTAAQAVGVPAGIGVVALALGGWARRLRRPGVVELWVPLYAGILLAWPITWGAERLVLPMLPALLAYAGEAFRDLLRHVGGARVPVALATAAALALALLSGLTEEVQGTGECRAEARAGNPYPCMDPAAADLMNLAVALRGRLPQGSVVISRKPTLFFAMSGYRSRMYPLSARPDSFFRAAHEAGARFVAVDQIADLAPLYLHPILLARRDAFCVATEPRFAEAALAVIDTTAPPRPAGLPENSYRGCTLRQYGGR